MTLNESNNIRLVNNSIDGDQALSLFKSNNVVIQGNQIGLDSGKNHHEGDHYWSVSLYSSTGITLGGPNPGEGNTIAMSGFRSFNPPEHKAIEISNRGYDESETVRLRHSGNDYVAHPTQGLSTKASVADLNNDGIDTVDFGDLDGKQNSPRMAFVTSENGNLRFEGNLESHLGGARYYLDFYRTPTPLPSGHGGANMFYIGRGIVETDIAGYGQFDILIPFSDFQDSDYFTATAIRMDGSGGTSEFSRNRQLNENLLKDFNRAAFGDRNGDGTDDVDQDNVASFSAANGADTTVEVSAAAAPSSDILLAKGRGFGVPLDNAIPILQNVLAETQAAFGAPANYNYSNGIITFEVPNLSAGASISVNLILANDATPDTLWILKPYGAWTNTLPATIEGNQVTLTLTDGGDGDRDGQRNGRIVAVLGPSTAQPPIPDMDLTIALKENSHTLTWPLAYSNALLEYSPDLSPDSWSLFDFFDKEISGGLWQVTRSNPQNELIDTGFYRLRYQAQSDSRVPYHTWLRKQLMTEYGITGGEWITGTTESEAMATVFLDSDVTRTDFVVENQPFVWAINLQNATAPTNFWEDFTFFYTQDRIADGDVLLLVAWVRGVDTGQGLPTIAHNFEMTEAPYTKIYSQQVVTSAEWTQYIIPMEATFDLPTSWYVIHMGFAVQEIEVGGVAVLNYGNKYTIDQLPKLNVP